MSALITATDARNTAAQFPVRHRSKFMPAIVEALSSEIRKAFNYATRELKNPAPIKKVKKTSSNFALETWKGQIEEITKPHADKIKCEKIIDALEKLGFTVDIISEPHPETKATYKIKITWPEKPEQTDEKKDE